MANVGRPVADPRPRHGLVAGEHWRAVYEPGPVRRFFGAIGCAIAACYRGAVAAVEWISRWV